jgi:hypothetical protein
VLKWWHWIEGYKMITQDPKTGEVLLKDHAVRVEFLIHSGRRVDEKYDPATEIQKNAAATNLLEMLGYEVDSFEMTVIVK